MLFLSFMNLFRNYRRTIAILLTIALGTGVLFAFNGFIHGVLTLYRENTIHSYFGHGQVNTKNYRETVFAEPWQHWMTDSDQLQSFLISQDKVAQIFPRISFSALLKKGNVSLSGAGQGIMAEREAQFFHGLKIENGVPLTSQSNGIVLGLGLAKALDIQPGDSVTLTVNATDGFINHADFVVTGIFNTGSADFDNRMFRVPLDKTQELLKTSSIESITIGLKDYMAWTAFAKIVEENYPTLEATSFAVLDKIYYQHSVDWLNAQFHIIQLIILSIVLLGIFNSISSSILERKQEIGNFRANGESVMDIMRLITMEGAFLGILGSCLGIIFAFILLKGFLDKELLMPPGPGHTRPFYVTFQFEWFMVYSTVGLTTAASVIASLLAGIRVATTPIAKALRAY